MKNESWKVKIYVGEFYKFVLCDMFPDDEKHSGLEPFLEFFAAEEECIVDSGTKKGFYWAHLKMDNGVLQDPEDDESFLYIDRLERIISE